MSNYTPGPWGMPDSGQGRISKVGANGGWDGLIATADCGDYARSRSEGLANARLIAAAPELLEAATKALGALNALHIQCDVACVVEPEGEIYLRPVINALRQVIAKATGEQA